MGLLRGVKEVVISSHVDLKSLVKHISALPMHYMGEPFLEYDLTVKVLLSPRAAVSIPPIKEHIPQSFFSFETTPANVVSLYKSQGDGALLAMVDSAFSDCVSIYCELLQSSNLPGEVLHSVLPYAHGDLTDLVLGEILGTINKLMAGRQSNGR